MKNDSFNDVYYTLLGELVEDNAVTWVENAYEPGSECDRLYSQALDAYEQLRKRLGVQGEDPDVEIILGNLISIQRILCQKMFLYGQLMQP